MQSGGIKLTQWAAKAEHFAPVGEIFLKDFLFQYQLSAIVVFFFAISTVLGLRNLPANINIVNYPHFPNGGKSFKRWCFSEVRFVLYKPREISIACCAGPRCTRPVCKALAGEYVAVFACRQTGLRQTAQHLYSNYFFKFNYENYLPRKLAAVLRPPFMNGNRFCWMPNTNKLLQACNLWLKRNACCFMRLL